MRRDNTPSTEQPGNASLRPVDGIDCRTRRQLEAYGLDSVADVASASIEDLRDALDDQRRRRTDLRRIRNNAKRLQYSLETGRARPEASR